MKKSAWILVREEILQKSWRETIFKAPLLSCVQVCWRLLRHHGRAQLQRGSRLSGRSGSRHEGWHSHSDWLPQLGPVRHTRGWEYLYQASIFGQDLVLWIGFSQECFIFICASAELCPATQRAGISKIFTEVVVRCWQGITLSSPSSPGSNFWSRNLFRETKDKKISECKE